MHAGNVFARQTALYAAGAELIPIQRPRGASRGCTGSSPLMDGLGLSRRHLRCSSQDLGRPAQRLQRATPRRQNQSEKAGDTPAFEVIERPSPRYSRWRPRRFTIG